MLYRIKTREWGTHFIEASDLPVAISKMERYLVKEWKRCHGDQSPQGRARRDLDIVEVELLAEGLIR